ncbi:hypothetical protein D3C81_1945130 [compost metagenome]
MILSKVFFFLKMFHSELAEEIKEQLAMLEVNLTLLDYTVMQEFQDNCVQYYVIKEFSWEFQFTFRKSDVMLIYRTNKDSYCSKKWVDAINEANEYLIKKLN